MQSADDGETGEGRGDSRTVRTIVKHKKGKKIDVQTWGDGRGFPERTRGE